VKEGEKDTANAIATLPRSCFCNNLLANTHTHKVSSSAFKQLHHNGMKKTNPYPEKNIPVDE
jgi:hypothetical protein